MWRLIFLSKYTNGFIWKQRTFVVINKLTFNIRDALRDFIGLPQFQESEKFLGKQLYFDYISLARCKSNHKESKNLILMPKSWNFFVVKKNKSKLKKGERE